MQELRLVAVSEDGTYLVLATAGRGTRFTLPVDDRLRAAVRGNFSRLGQFEIEVESPLRPKEIQARIRAGETAEEIAATAGIPVERVRWFEGPVLQEREYIAQQAQRVAVRLPGESAARPTLGELVAERLTRRGVPVDEIDWDSCKRDDNLWRIKLGYVWNGHTRHAEWLFDPRRRHVSPYDDEAMRLSADDYADPQAEEATVRPFVPRIAGKLAPVPPPEFDVAEPAPLRVAPNGNLPDHFSPRFTPEPSLPAAFHEPAAAEPPRPPQNYGPPEPQVSAPPSQPTHYYTAPEPPPAAPPAKDTRLATAEPQAAEPQLSAPVTPEPQVAAQETPSAPEPQAAPAAPAEPVSAPATPEPQVSAPVAEARPSAPEEATAPEVQSAAPEAPAAPATPEAAAVHEAAPEPKAAEPVVPEAQPVAPETQTTPAAPAAEARPAEPAAPVVDRAAEEAPAFVAPEAPAVVPAQPTPAPSPAPAPEPVAEEPVEEPPTPAVMPKTVAPRPGPPRAKPPAQRPAPKEDKPSEPVPAGAAPAPAPKPAPRRKSRARRASVPSWDEIMFGAPKQD